MLVPNLLVFSVMFCAGNDDVTQSEILTAWSQHNPGLQQVTYTIRGHVTTTPAFLAGLPVTNDDIPDAPMPLRIRCYIDFSLGKLKVQRDEYIWHVPTNEFQRRLSSFVVVGGEARQWEFFPSLKQERTTSPIQHQALIAELLPVWSNSGISHFLFGIPSNSLFEARPDAFEVTTWKIVKDKWLQSRGQREAVVRFEASSDTVDLLLDTEADYRIIGFTRKKKGRTTSQMTFVYQTFAGYMLASEWEISFWSGSGKMQRHVALQMASFSPTLPEQLEWRADGEWLALDSESSSDPNIKGE